MPDINGIEMLVRKKQLTEDEWCKLLECRRSLIKPHLKSFTLPALGDLKCMQTENSTHELSMDAPWLTGDRRFTLKTQGIFHRSRSSIVEISNSGFRASSGGCDCPDGTMYIWGLSRKGEWILAKVKFTGESGYKERGCQRAFELDIHEADIQVIIETTKSKSGEIWKVLGESISNWVAFRKELYNDAASVLRIVQIEEMALSLIALN